MSLLATAKRLSIAVGLYVPARWFYRRIRPRKLDSFRSDVALYRSLALRGTLCFDVGANIGEKSEAMWEAGARVVAFEPNPLVLPELRARSRHRRDWVVVASALGGVGGIVTLHAREVHGTSSLAREWQLASGVPAGDVVADFEVPIVTLDSAIQHFGSPEYCKIDVEGWELEVLNGLTHSIPLLSFEFHLTDLDIRKTIACLEKLADFGPSRVNITPAEASSFHFEDWMPLEQFVAWFPGDLHESLPGDPYGDIFVRRHSA